MVGPRSGHHGDGDLSDERAVTVPGLAGNVEYTLQLRAVNGLYAGAPSDVTVTTLSSLASR